MAKNSKDADMASETPASGTQDNARLASSPAEPVTSDDLSAVATSEDLAGAEPVIADDISADSSATDSAAVVPQDEAQAGKPAKPTKSTKPAKPEKQLVKGSFAGGTWVALIAGALLLIVLLVFIMQNQEPVELVLFAWNFTFPAGIGFLLAAIGGALIMALVGGVRMFQLRRQITKK